MISSIVSIVSIGSIFISSSNSIIRSISIVSIVSITSVSMIPEATCCPPVKGAAVTVGARRLSPSSFRRGFLVRSTAQGEPLV